MRVLVASGDRDVADGLLPAFADDQIESVDLAGLCEPAAFATVDRYRPAAVVLTPDWARAGASEMDEVRGCWWLARAADLAGVPVTLLSTAAVFDGSDRRPRSEFDAPAPNSAAGRLAHAAEQLLERTTTNLVVVRVGPLDVGALSLARLLGARGGILGGGGAEITPARIADVGPALRALSVGGRFGVWHLAGRRVSVATCAEALELPVPTPGGTPMPVPLVGQMTAMCGASLAIGWPEERS